MNSTIHTCQTCHKSEPAVKFYKGRYYICTSCYSEVNRLSYRRRISPTETNNTQENLPDLTKEQLIERVASLEDAVVKITTYLRDTAVVLDQRNAQILQLTQECAKKDEVIASFSSLNERVEDLEDAPPPVKRIVECAPESPKLTTDKQLIYDRIKGNKYNLSQLKEICEEHGIYISSKEQKVKSNFITALSKKFLELYPELTE